MQPSDVKLSIIIPAFNEEKLIASSIGAARKAVDALRGSGWDFEVIVCNNNSTDRTAAIALEQGAQVVFEPINQIARARNAGASVATGEWLLFIDADSWLKPALLSEVLAMAERGQAVGGGALVELENIPWIGRLGVGAWNLVSRTFKLAAGSFIFARADAFRAVGGFGTLLFAAEELELSNKLKAWGRAHRLKFPILTHHRHCSSGRKFRLFSPWQQFVAFLKMSLLAPVALRSRRHLDYFYGGRR